MTEKDIRAIRDRIGERYSQESKAAFIVLADAADGTMELSDMYGGDRNILLQAVAEIMAELIVSNAETPEQAQWTLMLFRDTLNRRVERKQRKQFGEQTERSKSRKQEAMIN